MSFTQQNQNLQCKQNEWKLARTWHGTDMVVGYEKEEILTQQQKFIAGVVTGIFTRFVTQPLDIVKVRTQLQSKKKDKRKTWLRLSLRILREEGAITFWHGHSLGQIHSIISVSSQFLAYELSTKWVDTHLGPYVSPDIKQVLFFTCGIFAGCTSATLVSPLEVIRVRQMVLKAQYGSMWQGARVVYRSGGLLAFYEGLPASLIQMGPQVGITFAVFRFCQPLVMNYMTQCDEEVPNEQKKVTKKNLLVASSLAGSVAGFVSKSLTYPFDLAKRRLQIASHQADPNVKAPSTTKNLIKCTSLFGCLMDMIRKDGFTGMFIGWSITIYKAQLTSVVAFTSYEMMCHLIREYNPVVDHKG